MPGPRRATRARRPSRSRKEIEEERFAPKPLTPREVMRKRVIQVGVGILLLAFMFTSGIVCVNMGNNMPREAEEQPKQSQLSYYREQVAKDPTNMQAAVELGHALLVEASSKPEGDERTKMLTEAEGLLNKVAALPNDSNRAAALQDLARMQLAFKKDNAAAMQTVEELLKHAQRPMPPAKDDAARVAMEEARNAEKASALMLKAEVQAEEQKFAESLATLEELSKLNPPNATQVLIMKSQLYMELGEKQKALGELDLAEKFASNQQEQLTVMFMKQQLLAPPPSASPAPSGSPEAVPSPGASSPGPEAASPAPAPAAAPSPAPVSSPAPAASPAPVSSPSP